MEVFDYKLHLDKNDCVIIPRSFSSYMEDNILTVNKDYRKIISLLKKVAKTEVPILLQGPTGVGKEVLADFIHKNSLKNSAPFIKLNCAAIPEQLMESEFFGYMPGSFTGASGTGKKGLIELANGGTMFLDEIAEMPLHIQAKLLRFLQDGNFLKVGGSKEYKANVRIIAATNKNLQISIKNGIFREDLYFRLNVVPISLLKLEDRKDDIPLLIIYFLDFFNKQYGTNKRISYATINALIDYPWPGNVRQLRNTIERLVLITVDNIITKEELAYTNYIIERYNAIEDQTLLNIDNNDKKTLKEIINELEKEILINYVKKYGSIRKAASILRVAPSTISRKISKI